MFEQYVRALSIKEVLDALYTTPKPNRILAGGTDLLLQSHNSPNVPYKSLIDISNVAELVGIREESGGLWIGAATKLSDIETSSSVGRIAPVLMTGASEVGSIQIRNLATIGGNLCNASPSADTVPALLVLDSKVKLVSQYGEREIPLSDFFVGPGKTVLTTDEILTAVIVPPQPIEARSTYIKLKTREALDLAFVGVAVLISWERGKIAPRIALGAVAPTPIRAFRAEQVLTEAQTLNDTVIQNVARIASEEISPISDVRASANYRKEMVINLTVRALKYVLKPFLN